jgi:hypothetical protein
MAAVAMETDKMLKINEKHNNDHSRFLQGFIKFDQGIYEKQS